MEELIHVTPGPVSVDAFDPDRRCRDRVDRRRDERYRQKRREQDRAQRAQREATGGGHSSQVTPSGSRTYSTTSSNDGSVPRSVHAVSRPCLFSFAKASLALASIDSAITTAKVSPLSSLHISSPSYKDTRTASTACW